MIAAICTARNWLLEIDCWKWIVRNWLLEICCLKIISGSWFLEIDCPRLIAGNQLLDTYSLKLIAGILFLEIDCWKFIVANWLLKINCWKSTAENLMLEIDCCKLIAGKWLLNFWLTNWYIDFVTALLNVTDLNNCNWLKLSELPMVCSVLVLLFFLLKQVRRKQVRDIILIMGDSIWKHQGFF